MCNEKNEKKRTSKNNRGNERRYRHFKLGNKSCWDGDSGSDDSDIEYQPDDLEDTFDPAVQLEVEEELDMDKFVDIKLAQKKSRALSKWIKSEDLDITVCINESIVPYVVQHGPKLKDKQFRLGHKLWMLCGSDGCPYHMIFHQEKECQAANTSLSTRVATTMLSCGQVSQIEHKSHRNNLTVSHQW
ncbi:hypothetical protein T06_6242 [Trichinella sp. T6]|nr:hypothetical protein T06_6242 [Trichinella sp. T6]